jgi:hypothetical protein
MTERVDARFYRLDDHVVVDLGRPIRVLNFDYETAYSWARTLIKLAEQAQRVGAGRARMSRKEVDLFEESIVSPNHKVIGS